MTGGAPAQEATSNPVRGVLWMLASMACFTIMSIAIRPASAELHPFEVLFFRNVIGLSVMAPWIVRSGLGALRTRFLPLHVLRSLLVLIAMMTWFYVVTVIPFVDATALNFTAPLFSSLLAMLILNETIRWRRWSAIIIGFLGAIVVLRPGMGVIDPNAFIALINPVAWAGAVILIKKLSRTDSTGAIVAYMFILLMPLSFIPAYFVWREPTLAALPWILMVGLGGACGHLCAAKAIALAPTSLVMPIEYLRLPFLGLIGFAVYHEIPDRWTLLGSAIIVAAAFYVGHRETRTEQARMEASGPAP